MRNGLFKVFGPQRKVSQAKSLIMYSRVDGPRLEFGTQNVEKKAKNGVSENGVGLPLRDIQL